MAVVWLGFSFLYPSHNPQPEPATQVSGDAQAKADSAAGSAVKKTATEPAAPSAPSVTMEEKTMSSGPGVATPEDVVVDTDRYRAVFSTLGARLKYFELKKYKLRPEPDSPNFAFVDVGPPRLATLRTMGLDGLSLSEDQSYHLQSPKKMIRLEEGESAQVVFQARTAAGLEVEKVFSFSGDRYDFQLQVNLANQGEGPVKGVFSLSLIKEWTDSEKSDRFDYIGPVTLVGDDVKTEKMKELEKSSPIFQKPVWSAFEDKYFIGAVVPLKGSAEQVRIKKIPGSVENIFESPYLTLGTGETASQSFLLYFGPRDLDVLKAVDHRLAEAIDFGFFKIIAKPLLHVLKFFYSFVGNYGVAIILLTVIIKMLFWPLTQKSYTSMKSMQKLQPEMQRIRDKYKSDKERVNQEIMGLYKTHKVNPLGGCLPMLIQIPVFFALYKVLLGSIELRQAPFAFWLTDLSTKDPLYITPVIMGVTMFVQQRMTPSTMDSAQAKIFMAMPIVFTFMFLNFPSGLVIYWLVNNLLTIGQQYLINRKAA